MRYVDLTGPTDVQQFYADLRQILSREARPNESWTLEDLGGGRFSLNCVVRGRTASYLHYTGQCEPGLRIRLWTHPGFFYRFGWVGLAALGVLAGLLFGIYSAGSLEGFGQEPGLWSMLVIGPLGTLPIAYLARLSYDNWFLTAQYLIRKTLNET